MFRFLILNLLFMLIVADDFVRVKIQPRLRKNRQSAIRRFISNEDKVNETLKDVENMYYEGFIHVGTPPRKFMVDFDTGSPVFWLTIDGCVDETDSCKVNESYDVNNSTTGRSTEEPFLLQYGKGNTSGTYVFDTVGLTENDTIGTIKDLKFGAADKLSEWNDVCDGLLGLSFPYGNKPSFIGALIENKVFKNPIFTVWLQNVPDRNSKKLGGEIFFGGQDSTRCGDVIVTTKAQVIPKSWWTFKLDSVQLDGNTLGNELIAVTDTGTSIIMVPSSVYNKIVETYPILAEETSFDCEQNDLKDLKLELIVEGNALVLTGNDLLIQTGHGKCFSGVELKNSKSQFDFLLGDVFIRKYCQIHNYEEKTLAFADSKHVINFE